MTRHVTNMTIYDVDHYTDEDRQRIINQYPEWIRDARIKGIPILGSGQVFPISEENLRCEPFEVNPTWPHIGGVDFGMDHPFGAVKCVVDPVSGVFYVTDTYRAKAETIVIHAAALKRWGNLIFGWPHDGGIREKRSGTTHADIYMEHGLNFLPEHAKNDDGSHFTEPAIERMVVDMKVGMFKVFSNLIDWWEEFRLYHRKDGEIVKKRDDLMSATRMAYLCRGFAKPVSRETSKYRKPDRRWVV